MRGLRPLLRKEALHWVRSFRLWVVLGAFLLVGIGSPALTWLTPALLASIPEEQMAGLELLMLQDPTVTDALVQYLGNFGLLVLLVLLLSMGAVAGEVTSGTAPMVLSKPVSRRAFLASKVAIAAAVYAVATALGAGACLGLSGALFGPVALGGYVALHGLLLLHLLVHLALAVAASAFAPTRLAAAGWAFGGWIALVVLAALPRIGVYTPGGLLAQASALVAGKELDAPAATLVAALLAVAALLVAADRRLRRRPI